jgi:hypothetical protein
MKFLLPRAGRAHARRRPVSDYSPRTALSLYSTHVLLLLHALLAVVRVADPGTPAHDAAPLERAVVALVAELHLHMRPHVRVADDALAVALLAEAADGDAGLLAAHNKVRVCATREKENARANWGGGR